MIINLNKQTSFLPVSFSILQQWFIMGLFTLSLFGTRCLICKKPMATLICGPGGDWSICTQYIYTNVNIHIHEKTEKKTSEFKVRQWNKSILDLVLCLFSDFTAKCKMLSFNVRMLSLHFLLSLNVFSCWVINRVFLSTGFCLCVTFAS